MINQEELAICKRRGHEARGIFTGWRQCKWCKLWLRNVQATEEREDDPPEAERDSSAKRLLGD